jgi:PAS domain S-box-containing protein
MNSSQKLVGQVGELEHTELTVSTSEAELHALFAAMTDFVFVFNSQGRHLKTVPTSPILSHASSFGNIDESLYHFIPPAEEEPFLGYICRAISTQRTVKTEYELTIGSEIVFFEASISPMPGDSVVWVARDITERKQAEERLKKSEERFRSYFEQPLVGIAVTSPEKGWLAANDKICQMLGYPREQLLQLTWAELTHPEDLVLDVQLFKQLLAGEIDQYSMDKRYFCKNGEILHTHIGVGCVRQQDGTVDFVVAVIQDITERKKAEAALQQSEAEYKAQARQLEQALRSLRQTQAQLIQSEKMSSLGQLVAGIAHEINNPINFIYGNLTHVSGYVHDVLNLIELYRTQYPNPTAVIQDESDAMDLDFLIEDLPKVVASMRVGTERIRQIVLSLRNFSRLDEAEKKSVDIHEGIDSTLLILQNRTKARGENSGIQIIKEFGDLPLVECYPGQLNQVFMNLLANAIDALEEHHDDRSPEAVQQNPSTIRITTEVSTDDWVTIRIADNGPGIPKKSRERLFDPFFTTKPTGKGTGLGLAISYQIVVEKHGGTLECNSNFGHGAEFVIKIPVHQCSTL